MGENERETEEKTADLDELFFEIEQIKIHLEEAYDYGEDGEVNLAVLLLLVNIAIAKLHYYSEKYQFKVPQDDLFYVDKAMKFATAKALFDESEKKEREAAIAKIGAEALEKRHRGDQAMKLWRNLMVDNEVIRGQVDKYEEALGEAGLELSDNPLYAIYKVTQKSALLPTKEEVPEGGEEA